MLVLFMCLGIAVVVQTLAVAVICGTRALDDERAGRARMEEKDAGLAGLRQHALMAWAETPWMVVSDDGHIVEGCLAEAEAESEWVLAATVRQEPDVSRLVTSALLERGRDGIDLPLAALAAGSLTAAEGRSTAWLEVEEGTEAVAHLQHLPADPALGAGCSLEPLTAPWRLDPGWAALFGEEAPEGAEGLGPGPSVVALTGPWGLAVELPVDSPGRSADDPALVVVTGGVHLDAQDLGDLYGVIVVDDGSARLDGTTLHGAIFATGSVDLGETGRVVYNQAVLRWATDRSLVRTRLVPGSRWEGTE
ncbi:MAG: hypothetical protein JW990_09255 [Thermoleophilia bacterium]|nr:hypothetical protein [Thermoleophilia bacterium]